jgi:hypothetical protein
LEVIVEGDVMIDVDADFLPLGAFVAGRRNGSV